VALEVGKRAVVKCRRLGGAQHHPRRGIGVLRSLPRALLNARKSAVMTAQTVWLPTSSAPVLQQPSR